MPSLWRAAAATSRIELTNNITMANSIAIAGRTAATASHLLNVSGNNTISGASLTTGGNQYVIQSDADKLSLGSITNNTGDASARYVYLQGSGNGEVTGVIVTGTGTGPVNLSKSGGGTWTLKGANTYTGNTTINGGTLALAATGSIASSPVIDAEGSGIFDVTAFGSGYTLGASTAQKLQGTGTVNGTLVNGAVGTISPAGNGTAGTINIQNLTLGSVSGGIVTFDLSSSTSSGNDLLNVTGNLSALGSASPASTTFNINMLSGSLATGTYKLVNYGTWDSGGSINNIGLSGVAQAGRPHGKASDYRAPATKSTSQYQARRQTSFGKATSAAPGIGIPPARQTGSKAASPISTTIWIPLHSMPPAPHDQRQRFGQLDAGCGNGELLRHDYTFSGTGGITGGSAMTLTKAAAGKLILCQHRRQ